MSTTWVISDPHFGHQGVCNFLRADGVTKLRPFDTAAEMDETIVKNWNGMVTPQDKVYVLGDVVIARKNLAIMSRLNGTKVLIKGNHDIFKLSDYTKYFRDIRAYHIIAKHIMSHIPVHPDSKGRFLGNIHGHTHEHRMMKDGRIDPWYFSVCVEHTNYRPVLLDDVLKGIQDQKDSAEIDLNPWEYTKETLFKATKRLFNLKF